MAHGRAATGRGSLLLTGRHADKRGSRCAAAAQHASWRYLDRPGQLAARRQMSQSSSWANRRARCRVFAETVPATASLGEIMRFALLAAIGAGCCIAGCAAPPGQPPATAEGVSPTRPTAPVHDPAFDGPDQTGWVRGSETYQSVTWLHTASKVRQGDTVRIWDLLNYKIGHKFYNGAFSVLALVEIDCRRSLSRNLSIISYEGLNKTGRVLANDNNLNYQWTPVPPGTVIARTQTIACDTGGPKD